MNNPSMLKKVWIISKDSSCKFIKVRLQAIWTEMPKYRSLDSVVVEWDYASYYPAEGKYSEVVVTHFWDEQIKYKMISVAFNLARGKIGALSALYTWASGSNKSVSCELSGIDEVIPFEWK